MRVIDHCLAAARNADNSSRIDWTWRYRGRFANYVPPLMERLGLAEVEHNPRNNRMRAL